ncbi:Protein of unknown function [Gryllus bimaculatus]|nr:Protein of unknown function [Gryllus bimaculatus]
MEEAVRTLGLISQGANNTRVDCAGGGGGGGAGPLEEAAARRGERRRSRKEEKVAVFNVIHKNVNYFRKIKKV